MLGEPRILVFILPEPHVFNVLKILFYRLACLVVNQVLPDHS